mmetsp:Transcript_2250/g.3539  ORF Transcript_2250/g.3539 Transcript_2250/m.3539 type:complete len:88 (+) Transcript_2250:198-461(+)
MVCWFLQHQRRMRSPRVYRQYPLRNSLMLIFKVVCGGGSSSCTGREIFKGYLHRPTLRTYDFMYIYYNNMHNWLDDFTHIITLEKVG